MSCVVFLCPNRIPDLSEAVLRATQGLYHPCHRQLGPGQWRAKKTHMYTQLVAGKTCTPPSLWPDTMWSDTVWCDTVWCDVILYTCDVILCDVTLCDVTLCDVIHHIIAYNAICYCVIVHVMWHYVRWCCALAGSDPCQASFQMLQLLQLLCLSQLLLQWDQSRGASGYHLWLCRTEVLLDSSFLPPTLARLICQAALWPCYADLWAWAPLL